jgi:hypothetical protein
MMIGPHIRSLFGLVKTGAEAFAEQADRKIGLRLPEAKVKTPHPV